MHNRAKSAEFSKQFLHPKYWGIWLLVGLLRILHCLPFNSKYWLGKKIGRLFYKLSKSRRDTAISNISMAFPELDQQQVLELTQKHFESIGISLFESMLVWWGTHRRNKQQPFEKSLVSYENIDYLKQAEASDKGVIILVPHFTTTDIIGLFLSFITSLKPVYRPHDNPLMDYLIAKGRTLDNMTPISKFNTRAMIKTLKNGENLGFLPDQRYRAKGHIKVPFFGKDAPSNPATSKLAKMTGCIVLPTFLKRLDNNQYVLRFEQPVDNFPSGDDYQDTLKLHQIYEAAIQDNPAQYLWVHNRWDLKE